MVVVMFKNDSNDKFYSKVSDMNLKSPRHQ